MKLTDEQRRTVCVCAICLKQLDLKATGDALERGETSPGQLFCQQCHPDTYEPEYRDYYLMELATQKAGELVKERSQEANVLEFFEHLTYESVKKQQGDS